MANACAWRYGFDGVEVHFTAASYEPMSLLSIDTIGPLAEDEDGHAYIL